MTKTSLRSLKPWAQVWTWQAPLADHLSFPFSLHVGKLRPSLEAFCKCEERKIKSLRTKGQVNAKYNNSNKTNKQDSKHTGSSGLKNSGTGLTQGVRVSAFPLQTVYLVHVSAPHFPHLSNRFNNIYLIRLLLRLSEIVHIELIYNTGI